MRKLILQMQFSLDGFVAGPNGKSRGFGRQARTSWAKSLMSDMAAHWPSSTEPFAPPMNQIPKIVFSRSLNAAPWGETRIAAGDLASEINLLKNEPGGNLLAHGGVRFAQSLIRSGLIDEYRLIVHPIVPGQGLRIFTDLTKPMRLDLTDTQVFKTGAIAKTFHFARANEPGRKGAHRKQDEVTSDPSRSNST